MSVFEGIYERLLKTVSSEIKAGHGGTGISLSAFY
jgi:hypothetical protein